MPEFKIIQYDKSPKSNKIVGIKRYSSPEDRGGVTLKGMDGRVAEMEQLISVLGQHLNSNNWDPNKALSKTLVQNLIKECHKHKIIKPSEITDKKNPRAGNTKNAFVKALNFWYQNHNLHPTLTSSTTSSKMMETVFVSYFKEFDPHQVYFTPQFFFDSIIDNQEGSLLGPVTTALSLRVASLQNNSSDFRLDYLYQQCLVLLQSHLPSAYSNPNVENVIALLFLSLHRLTYSDTYGFLNYFSSACKMALLLEFNTARDLYKIHPRGTQKWYELNRKDVLWQLMSSVDSFLSIIYGLPSQFPKSTRWLKNGQVEETFRFINLTPFFTIPTNPPKLISSLDNLTPAVQEVNIVSMHIIHHVKTIKEKYSHLTSMKDVPLQEIFLPNNKFNECLKLYKVIQTTLIDQYTKEIMKNYIEETSEHNGFLRLIDNIVQALVLVMKFHYPHLLVYPQPVIMPSSFTPRLTKVTEQIISIFSDFVHMKPKDSEIRCPIQVDHLWSCLFSCLNLSLLNPSNRINGLIEKCIFLLTEKLDNKFTIYKTGDLPQYLKRYGHSVDQYSSSSPC